MKTSRQCTGGHRTGPARSLPHMGDLTTGDCRILPTTDGSTPISSTLLVVPKVQFDAAPWYRLPRPSNRRAFFVRALFVCTLHLYQQPISGNISNSASENGFSYNATHSLICSIDAPKKPNPLRVGHRGHRRDDGVHHLFGAIRGCCLGAPSQRPNRGIRLELRRHQPCVQPPVDSLWAGEPLCGMAWGPIRGSLVPTARSLAIHPPACC